MHIWLKIIFLDLNPDISEKYFWGVHKKNSFLIFLQGNHSKLFPKRRISRTKKICLEKSCFRYRSE
jgi:hypothetical protein